MPLNHKNPVNCDINKLAEYYRKAAVKILCITLKAWSQWEFYHLMWQGSTETEYFVTIYLVFIIYLQCGAI